MKQGKLRPWFRMLGMTILGSAIFALGFDLFLLPNQINIGGVSGIGMLLLELTGWGASAFTASSSTYRCSFWAASGSGGSFSSARWPAC